MIFEFFSFIYTFPFYVKKFTTIAKCYLCNINRWLQSIYADHILRDGKGVFKDRNAVNLIDF